MPLSRRSICALTMALLTSGAAIGADATPPWTSANLVSASDLNRQRSLVHSGKITLIHVGFGVMYRMGHIPGSHFAGPASQPDGVAALKKLQVISKPCTTL